MFVLCEVRRTEKTNVGSYWLTTCGHDLRPAPMLRSMSATCARCGTIIDDSDCWGIVAPHLDAEADDELPRAVACRVEHVASWAVRGGKMPPWNDWPDRDEDLDPATTCAHCGETIDDNAYRLVRFKDTERIPYGFCSLEHMKGWALAGGPWAKARS